MARQPQPHETSVLLRGLERYQHAFRANPEAARRYIRHGDSAVDNKFEANELAAYTAVASVILNLDEAVTKE
jgi:hypothetical protein